MLKLSDGRKFECQLKLGTRVVSVKAATEQFNKFNYKLRLGNRKAEGVGDRGDYCVWMPIDDKTGIKIILPSAEFPLDRLYDNLKYIQKIKSPVFPEIHSITKTDEFLVVEMERVHSIKKKKVPNTAKKWLKDDVKTAEDLLENNLEDLNRAIREITKHELCPEDEWYKQVNMINGKVIDFHWFYHSPERYKIETSVSKQELNDIYQAALKRYRSRGDNKWKGKIYQGFHFANGYTMEGYSSDGQMFDSYLKLPFCYMSKSHQAKVLDIGSNEGFLAIQAFLHGANNVLGIEMTPEDISLAENIKQVVGANSVKFVQGDGVKHIIKTKDKYDVVIMNSVLHQVYKNMEGSDKLLKSIAAKTKYFVYETPLNHPLMNISLRQVYDNLSKYFVIVRLLYLYNAYSSGYRANFVCYTFK